MMKNLKFLPFVMALVLGVSFALTSCDKDDDDNSSDEVTATMTKGQNFYKACQNLGNKDADALTKISATATALELASEYKLNSDKVWRTEFIAGLVMEKYGVSSKIAQTQEYLDKAQSIKSLLDDGITADNITTALITILQMQAGE